MATRLASGTLREDRFDFGVPNSPRTKLRRTRIRHARPVDVAPAQPEQLALAHPGHRRGQVHHALDPAEGVIGHGAQQRLDLLGVEEANIGIGHRDGRLLRPA